MQWRSSKTFAKPLHKVQNSDLYFSILPQTLKSNQARICISPRRKDNLVEFPIPSVREPERNQALQ